MSVQEKLFGTAAVMAARNPLVPKGAVAAESDTGVVKVGDGATRYNSLSIALTGTYAGKELGYTESATGVATTSNAGTLVTGSAATVTVGSHPIRVMWGALCESTTANALGYVELWQNGVRTSRAAFSTAGSAKYISVTGSRRFAPAAGSITYDVRLTSNDNTSTVTVIAGATFPCWLSITEV